MKNFTDLILIGLSFRIMNIIYKTCNGFFFPSNALQPCMKNTDTKGLFSHYFKIYLNNLLNKDNPVGNACNSYIYFSYRYLKRATLLLKKSKTAGGPLARNSSVNQIFKKLRKKYLQIVLHGYETSFRSL